MTEMPVGEILRRTRIHYKQSIEDVERALRIRASQIEAIETGNLSDLPARVYVIGFVRSYSEYLGLDGAKMVEIFKTQVTTGAKEPELNFPAAANDSYVPSSRVVMIALALVIVAITGWTMMSIQTRKMVEEIPAAPKAEEPQVQEQIKAQAQSEVQGPPVRSSALASGELAKTDQQKDGIILNIVENSWVEIKDQTGASILSRVLQAGDLYFVPDRPDLNISLGNAGGVRIEIDGKALRPLGGAGEVRRAIPLDMEYLKKTYAADVNSAPEVPQNSVENPE